MSRYRARNLNCKVLAKNRLTDRSNQQYLSDKRIKIIERKVRELSEKLPIDRMYMVDTYKLLEKDIIATDWGVFV